MTPIAIPYGQLSGEAITDVILLLIGVWLLWLWPRSVHRKIERGELSEEAGETALRKIPPKQGYLIMIVAIGLMFMKLWQVGFFGYSKLLALVPATFSVGLFILWLRHRNNG
jgi:hypothetical protein